MGLVARWMTRHAAQSISFSACHWLGSHGRVFGSSIRDAANAPSPGHLELVQQMASRCNPVQGPLGGYAVATEFQKLLNAWPKNPVQNAEWPELLQVCPCSKPLSAAHTYKLFYCSGWKCER